MFLRSVFISFEGNTLNEKENLVKGSKVAIKKYKNIFDNEQRYENNILNEIKILQTLNNHPNIIKLYDIIPPNTYNFNDLILIFEHADADLERIFKTNQFFSKLHVQYMLYNLLLGISYMHSSQIIHLNLRTRNIVVNEDCSIKIIDFHLAQNLAGKYKHSYLCNT